MKTDNVKLAILGLLITTGVVVSSLAPAIAEQKTTTDPVIAASGKTAESEALATRISEAGYQAMRAITGARIAIFNAKPELAKQLVTSAAGYLDEVANDDAKYLVSEGLAKSGSVANDLIPIDGSLYVADTFISEPDNEQKLLDANEKLKAGDSKAAIETLKLAAIDVSMQRILMPLGATTENVKAAANLLDKGQFYDANLALKAAVDRLVVDTIDIFQPE